MSLNKVCLVGANGRLGSVLLDGLVASNSFTISILKRASSTSTPAHASSVTQIPVPDSLPLEELTEALHGQDAVIAAFPLKDVSQHLRLVEASLRAGVKRFIPADFGSCDAASDNAKRILKLYRDKDMVREKCEQLAAHNPDSFSWTALVCGHFFDWALRDGLLHTNLDTHVAQLLDGGTTPASASTLRRVTEATVAVLRNPDATRNRKLYVQSFAPTQLEVVAALEKATGTEWKKEFLDSKEFVARHQAAADGGDHEAIEEIVFVLGALEADWREKDGFAMNLLGLQDEDLDRVVADVVAAYKRS